MGWLALTLWLFSVQFAKMGRGMGRPVQGDWMIQVLQKGLWAGQTISRAQYSRVGKPERTQREALSSASRLWNVACIRRLMLNFGIVSSDSESWEATPRSWIPVLLNPSWSTRLSGSSMCPRAYVTICLCTRALPGLLWPSWFLCLSRPGLEWGQCKCEEDWQLVSMKTQDCHS